MVTSGNRCTDSERALFFFFLASASEGAFAMPAEELHTGLALATILARPTLEEREIA